MPIDGIFLGMVWLPCVCTAMHQQDQRCSIQTDVAIIMLLWHQFGTTYVNDIIAKNNQLSLATLLTPNFDLTTNPTLLDDLCYQIAFSSLSELTARLEKINRCIIEEQPHFGRIYDNLPAILMRLDEIKLLATTIKKNHCKLTLLTQQVSLNPITIGKRLVEEVANAEIVFASFITNCFDTPARIQFLAEHDNGCQEQWHKLYKRFRIYLPTD